MFNNKRKTIETYDKIALQYSASHFEPFWVDEFEEYRKLIDGKKVLDIGCGAGRDAVVFVQNGLDYTGVDASEEMLKIAKERAPQGTLKQMDFYNLEFSDNVFDGFWAAASFLHVPKKDLTKVLAEAKRVLKPNGIGFISVKEKTVVDEGLIKENKHERMDRYFAFYTEEEFKKGLEEVELKVIKTATRLENDPEKTKWLCYFVQKI